MLTIREMNKDDIDQVFSIECESFSDPWSKVSLQNEIDNPNATYLVIIENNSIIAYAGLWKIFDEGHITNIAVKKEKRGKGIGTILTEKLISNGKNKSIFKFTLEVRENNINAIKMYKKIGFKEVGIRKDFYDKPKENAIIMWLNTVDN